MQIIQEALEIIQRWNSPPYHSVEMLKYIKGIDTTNSIMFMSMKRWSKNQANQKNASNYALKSEISNDGETMAQFFSFFSGGFNSNCVP